MTKEERKAYDKKYYAEHKEERKAYDKKYYEENKEEISAQKKIYYAKNKEERKAYDKKYYAEHKEEVLTQHEKYRDENPEKVKGQQKRAYEKNGRQKAAKRRARKLNQTPPDADLELIKEIYRKCPKGYEVDHIIPLSKGGLHHQDNLQYLTIYENRSKGAKIL